jgi:hypothetical protein
MDRWGQVRRLGRASLVGLLACAATIAGAQVQGVDPRADQLLRASTAYLSGQKQFRLSTRTTFEVVLKSGQKVQLDSTGTTTVQRPNKLFAERTSDQVTQRFYYDGKTFTIFDPGRGEYASVAAPDTLEAMMDFAREKLDVVAPAGDFIYANAYEVLMNGVTSGFVVGKSIVEGVRCDHLAFRAPDLDFQVWIQEGARPLPRKFVITTLDVQHAPQIEVVVTRWDLSPALSARTFGFAAPSGAKQVDVVPKGTGANK